MNVEVLKVARSCGTITVPGGQSKDGGCESTRLPIQVESHKTRPRAWPDWRRGGLLRLAAGRPERLPGTPQRHGGGRGERGVAASQSESNKAAGGTGAPRRVGAPGHRLEGRRAGPPARATARYRVVTRPGGGREGEGGGRGIAASQSNKAAGGTRALQRVGAPGHRLERLPCTAAATGGVWRRLARRLVHQDQYWPDARPSLAS